MNTTLLIVCWGLVGLMIGIQIGLAISHRRISTLEAAIEANATLPRQEMLTLGNNTPDVLLGVKR